MGKIRKSGTSLEKIRKIRRKIIKVILYDFPSLSCLIYTEYQIFIKITKSGFRRTYIFDKLTKQNSSWTYDNPFIFTFWSLI